MNKRKLPIGIQTFRTSREEGYYYVDKTPYLRRLVDEGTHYFLSRPRRFGKSPLLDTLKELFEGNEPLFRAFFSSIPCEWHTRNDIARFEGYYASVFYSHFAAAGLDVAVEDSSSHGRVDMAVRFNGHVYLFEFKVVELAPEGAAMEQPRERRYAEKYRHQGEPIHLIGVEFSREMRNVEGFEVARA